MKLKIDQLDADFGLTLPPDLVKRLGVSPGDWIEAAAEPDGGLILIPTHSRSSNREGRADPIGEVAGPAEPEA